MNVMKGPFIRNITIISAASDVEEIQEIDGNGGHDVGEEEEEEGEG